MPFETTYQEFLDEMAAVKRMRETVDDDAMVDLLLPLAYKWTMKKIQAYSLHDENRKDRWNLIKKDVYFDRHFGWQQAGQELQLLYEIHEDEWFTFWSSLKQLCLGNDTERYHERVYGTWNKAINNKYV